MQGATTTCAAAERPMEPGRADRTSIVPGSPWIWATAQSIARPACRLFCGRCGPLATNSTKQPNRAWPRARYPKASAALWRQMVRQRTMMTCGMERLCARTLVTVSSQAKTNSGNRPGKTPADGIGSRLRMEVMLAVSDVRAQDRIVGRAPISPPHRKKPLQSVDFRRRLGRLFAPSRTSAVPLPSNRF